MGLSGSLQTLAEVVLDDPGLRDVLTRAAAGDLPTAELTGPAALRPFAVAGLARSGSPVLVVTPTSREAEDLTAELAGFVPADSLAYYPSWETLPHERLSPRSDTVGRRLGVLRRLV